jgi:DNA-binding protein HU-beta
MTKSEMLSIIAEGAALTRKDVNNVFEALGVVIRRHVSKGGVGECTLPGLIKFRVVRKPAVKARKGVNPFTGEPTIFKAKPARNVIKVRTLKKLKEMAK